MRIKWLNRALIELDKEAEFIAQEDPQAAQLVVQCIYHCVSLLAGNPALGYAGRVHGTHELIIPKTRYIIPYRVRPRLQRIDILRVFHTSRKPPDRW